MQTDVLNSRFDIYWIFNMYLIYVIRYHTIVFVAAQHYCNSSYILHTQHWQEGRSRVIYPRPRIFIGTRYTSELKSQEKMGIRNFEKSGSPLIVPLSYNLVMYSQCKQVMRTKKFSTFSMTSMVKILAK